MGNSDFGLKIGIEGEAQFKKSLSEINQSFKILGSEMNLVTSQFDKQDKSAGALTARNQVLRKEIDAQKDKVETLEAALQNAASSFGENDKRTQAWQIQLNNANAALNGMERELGANETALDDVAKELNNAANQADGFESKLKQAGLETESSGLKFEKLGSVVKGVGVAIGAAVVAIGTAAVAAGVSLVKLGDEYNQSVNQISASTGATGAELEELGVIARNVYKHNFGESMADVAEGLSIVRKTTGLLGAELEKATQSGFALRDTFGFDLQESARAAGALMKNFGVRAEDAYNIIAVGAQNGADKNGDLLDTLNEYSAQYSALGLSADQFLASLVSGADAGVFSIDKVGDAVKEFNVRAKDGSSGTVAAFQKLGMHAETMMNRFASGGKEAQTAFFEVVGALDAMKDPMVKNSAAVALFGTMYEDLEANVLPVLAGMEEAAFANYDALSQISEIKYDNLDAAMEGTKRSLQGVFLPMVSEVSAGITDVFSSLGNAINEANGDFEAISAAIGTALGGITNIIAEKLSMFLDLGLNIIMAVGGAILNNLPLLIHSALGIVMTILTALIEALPQITDGALQLVLALVEGIVDNLPAIVEAAIEMIASIVQGIGDALPTLIPAMVEAVLLICETLLHNMDKVLAAAFSIVKGLAEGIIRALPKLIEALPKLITGIINFITQNLPMLMTMGIQLTVQLALGLIKAIPQLIAALPQIISALLNGLSQSVSSMVEIGKNIVGGLWEGIKSMASWLASKVRDFFSSIVRSAKKALGISSPSKVFVGIGENMGDSVGVGFTDAMEDVNKQIQSTIPTSVDVGAIDVLTNLPKSVGFGFTSDLLSEKLDILISEVRRYLPQLAGMQLVADTGATIGWLAPAMDDALGAIRRRKERLT
jgi:phage-related minor tail protein